jgi:hypothetical protein
MKRIFVLPFFCLLVLSVSAGCVARVGVVAEPVVVAGPAPVVVAAPAPAVEVAVEAPPPIAIAEPEMVVVPSGNEYVYMVPNVAGVYFYGGGWYRYYGGAWFGATVWGGPWVGIAVAPPIVVAIDPFFPFYLPVGYFHIGWGDFHSHWRSWGHDRHWHNHPQFRNEMRRDVRSARINQIRSDRNTGKINRFDRTGKVSGRSGQQFKSQQGLRQQPKSNFKQQGVKQQRTGINKQQGVKPQAKTFSKPQPKQNVQHGAQQGGQHGGGPR